VYIGAGDVEINLERIRQRVAAGGHDIPEADVRRRISRSLKNASLAAAEADFAIIFDNSGSEMIPIIDRDQEQIHTYCEIPTWATDIANALQSYGKRKA
jgi:predicted ABC-type ATPase